jgi:hypothetical protein
MSAVEASNPELELIEEAGRFTHDPLGWALFGYEWGKGELAGVTGPRAWQREVLDHIGQCLRDPATRHQPIRVARASGHGIGKSALIGILVNWGMSTCEETKVVITANTETQLRTKTSPEIGKWQRLSITAHWFRVQVLSVVACASKEWRCDLIPWSENNTEAFAGLHNIGKRIILIFDEGSAIADKVWETAEGALTDEDTEIIWIVFGNPTRNTGRFRECFRRFRHLWNHKNIDSRTVEGTNKAYLQQVVDTYGEDSDTAKVRVRGMFPSAGTRQLISTSDVDAAYGRHLEPRQYEFAPKIIGVDPAWEGDDELVIMLRQGLYSRVLRTLAKNDDDVAVATLIARLEDEHQADAVFVDAGYGTGIVSAGKAMGRAWVLVWFAGKATDPGKLNKRAEMWVDMRDWLKAGGAIPPDDVLYQDLIGPETVPRLDGKIQLESKDDMKDRLLPSPNRADALALTFAQPVLAKRLPGPATARHQVDYDPYA